MLSKFCLSALLVCSFFLAGSAIAKDKIQAYFSNDSINGVKYSDAYETHNMGLVYATGDYYVKLDLGIVSPDMYRYRNKYRDANRSFGELISLEIGEQNNLESDFHLYVKIKASGKYGIDNIQDAVHRLLFLQEVNNINNLVRMPDDAWIGVGVRKSIKSSISKLGKIEVELDGFFGSDTTFFDAKIKKEFQHSILMYNLSAGGRIVAFDQIVSSPPINGRERSFIPILSFGILYDAGPYNIFVRDTFSLPSLAEDNGLYGVLSAGVSYEF